MSPTIIGVIGIAVLVLVFFSRMPVAYVMTLIGYLGFSFLVSGTAGLKLLARDFFEVYSSYGLTIIPLFILMGQIAFNAGISRKLYDSAYKFVGSTKGGLAVATVGACTAFGAVCGSSPATAATMATVGAAGDETLRLRPGTGRRFGGLGRGAGHAHAPLGGSHRLRHPDRAIHRQAFCGRNLSGYLHDLLVCRGRGGLLLEIPGTGAGPERSSPGPKGSNRSRIRERPWPSLSWSWAGCSLASSPPPRPEGWAPPQSSWWLWAEGSFPSKGLSSRSTRPCGPPAWFYFWWRGRWFSAIFWP